MVDPKTYVKMPRELLIRYSAVRMGFVMAPTITFLANQNIRNRMKESLVNQVDSIGSSGS